MPKQTAKTGGMAAKYGDKARKAVESHGADETKFQTGAIRLPPGIDDGLAQLTKLYFAQYENGDLKGEYYFRGEAVVIEPKEFKGKRLEGRTTSIMEPACDTPKSTGQRKTQEDHIAWILNEMRKLGAQTKDVSFDDLETLAAQIQEAAPVFGFHTWSGARDEVVQINGKWYVQQNGKNKAGPYNTEGALKAANPFAGKDPRTNEVWDGVVSDQSSAGTVSPSQGVQDESPEATEAASAEVTGGLPDDLAALAELADGEGEQKDDAGIKLAELALSTGVAQDDIDNSDSWASVVQMIEKAGDSGSSDDLSALGAAGDDGDGDAQEKLSELAKAKGIDPDSVDTWTELAAMLGEGDDFVPVKGNVYLYKAKGAKKPVEHEVTAIFDDKKTVNLKNMDTKASIKGVPWADLVH